MASGVLIRVKRLSGDLGLCDFASRFRRLAILERWIRKKILKPIY